MGSADHPVKVAHDYAIRLRVGRRRETHRAPGHPGIPPDWGQISSGSLVTINESRRNRCSPRLRQIRKVRDVPHRIRTTTHFGPSGPYLLPLEADMARPL